MNDKNGKAVKVGFVVRTADGRTLRVAGILETRLVLIKAGECEITDAFLGGKDGGGDEEDGIVWGS